MKKTTILLFILQIALQSFAQTITMDYRDNLSMDSILKQGKEYEKVKALIGNGTVIQTIYKMDGTVIAKDELKYERKMVGNFLQETITPKVISEKNNFQRISYLNYNRTNLHWEYIVLDTRFPLMMYETAVTNQNSSDSIITYLDAFVLPPFFGKEYTGLLTRERRIIIFNENGNYIHRQYWTIPAHKEFLAIEYNFKGNK